MRGHFLNLSIIVSLSFALTGCEQYLLSSETMTPLGTIPSPTPSTTVPNKVNPPSIALVAEYTSTTASLVWRDNAENETGLELQKCSGANCTTFAAHGSTLAGNTKTASITGLTGGTWYSFRVRAVSTTLDRYSSWAYFPQFQTLSTPTAPSNLTVASKGAYMMLLTWSDNSDNEDEMVITRWTNADCTGAETDHFHLDPQTTTKTFSSLTANTAYCFNVYASNSIGTSASSAIATSTTLSLPADPSGLALDGAKQKTAISIPLAWTDNATGEEFYELKMCSGSGCDPTAGTARTLPADSTKFTVTGLTANTTYNFAVRAGIVDAYSASYATSGDIATLTPTAKITDLALTSATHSTIALSWSDLATETSYELQYCKNADCTFLSTYTVTIAANTSSWNSTGLGALDDGTIYRFRIRGLITGAPGEWSDTLVTATGPAAPTGITLGGTNGGDGNQSITLSWRDNSTKETGYEIAKCLDINCATSVTLTTTSANVTEESISLDAAYPYVGIRAKLSAAGTSGGTSPWITTETGGYGSALNGIPHVQPIQISNGGTGLAKIKAIGEWGKYLFIGGNFTQTTSDAVGINGFSVLNKHTGSTALATNSQGLFATAGGTTLSGTVKSIAAIGDGSGKTTVFVAGDFTHTVGGVPSTYSLLKIYPLEDDGNGRIPFTALTTTGTVKYVLASYGRLFIAGSFTAINGDSSYKYLAEINPATMQPVITFRPDINGTVSKIVADKEQLYFTGSFTRIGNMTQKYIGAVHATDGTTASFVSPLNTSDTAAEPDDINIVTVDSTQTNKNYLLIFSKTATFTAPSGTTYPVGTSFPYIVQLTTAGQIINGLYYSKMIPNGATHTMSVYYSDSTETGNPRAVFWIGGDFSLIGADWNVNRIGMLAFDNDSGDTSQHRMSTCLSGSSTLNLTSYARLLFKSSNVENTTLYIVDYNDNLIASTPDCNLR